jgi:mono/diheme cytochrome c family protein
MKRRLRSGGSGPAVRVCAALMGLFAMLGCSAHEPAASARVGGVKASQASSCGLDRRLHALIPAARASATVAVAQDGARTLAFIADQDARRVTVVDVDAGREVVSAELEGAPAALLVSPSGVVAVAMPQRSQIQLLEFDGKSLAPGCAFATAPEPVALSLTPDSRTLLVASAWGHTLEAHAAASLAELYRVDLPREPRAVVVDDEGRYAFVSHGVGGTLSRVDLGRRSVEHASLDAPLSFEARERLRTFRSDMASYLQQLEASHRAEAQAQVDAQIKALSAPERRANQGFSLVLAPRAGKTSVLIPQVEVDPGRPDLRSSGYGNGNQASVSPSIAVVDAASLSTDSHSIPPVPTWRDADGGGASCRLPRSAALDAASGRLLVACLGSDLLLGYDLAAPSPVDAEALRIPVAAGPTGVAIDTRRQRALVWSQFERVLSVVPLPDPRAPLARQDPAPQRIALGKVAGAELSSQLALGRRLFHAVDDPRIARDGRACASCHIDGRDDGFVWSTPRGPRRTKTLAGMAAAGAPYAWDGSAATLHEQIDGTLDRLEGEGGLRQSELDALVAYVSSLPRPPRASESEGDRVIARGRELFSSAQTGCQTCHVGEETSDGARHGVGSQTAVDATARFDTPSLALLAGRAPYFHDGRFASLRELLAAKGDNMGHTSQLSPSDLAALEAFLATL